MAQLVEVKLLKGIVEKRGCLAKRMHAFCFSRTCRALYKSGEAEAVKVSSMKVDAALKENK
jgi:hypothetical protein